MPGRTPTLEDLLAADTARARQLAQGKVPRRGNNPFSTGYEPPVRLAYPDPTGNQAAGNVDRERRRPKNPAR